MELMEATYKKTEIGLIPEDWQVVELGSIGNFKNGINKDKHSFGFGSPFINLMDVFGVPVLSGNEEFALVNSSKPEQELYNLKKGDVLFVRSSVKPSGVGLTCLIPFDIPNTVFSGFLIRYRDNGSLNQEFKRHCFYQEKFRNRVIAASTVSANTNINQDSLKRLKLALPPTLQEQKAIATALSDVDTLIANLDKLIAKKKSIKQGAMQRLLKSPAQGGQRLPGFEGEWVETTIGEEAKITTGSKNTQDKVEGGKYPFFVRSQTVERINTYSFEGEGILTAGDGVGTGKVFHYVNEKIDIHQRVYLISEFKSSIDGYFLFLIFQENFYDRIMSMTAKSSVDSVRREMIANMKIEIPPTKEEQKAIASILSDMDKEIESIESKKSKYLRIKHGMMQELLTGKTRLV